MQHLLPGEERSQRAHSPGKAEQSLRVTLNNSATCARWKRREEDHGDASTVLFPLILQSVWGKFTA